MNADVADQVLQRRANFIRSAFGFLDIDSGGTLTKDELATTCAVIGLKLTDEEVEDIIHEYDGDASGNLDIDEFVQLVLSRTKDPNEEMREAWSFFDVDPGQMLPGRRARPGSQADPRPPCQSGGDLSPEFS